MTTRTLTTSPHRSEPAARPLPWRRMVLVTWLQHRAALAGVIALFAGLTLYMTIVGLPLHHSWDAVVACHPASSLSCQNLLGHFSDVKRNGTQIATALQVLPALIGAFVGAPLLAREMETGTFRYTWTQGFGRTRWIIAKLALIGGTLTVIAAAFGELCNWYFGPYVAGNLLGPLDSRIFDLEGIAFPGWVLAAFAIGVFAGMLIRKVVPAMAATMAVVAGLGVAIGLHLRIHYLAPLVTTNVGISKANLTLTSWFTGRNGQVIDPDTATNLINQGSKYGNGNFSSNAAYAQDLAKQGLTQWTAYQPPSRFWPFQGIEGGGLLALAVLLVAATIWLVHRRAA
jgi:ABC-type transport system involved in multi-copper enzyme maturation permease subunit